MDNNRYCSALALALIYIACPYGLFAQNSEILSISALEKEDAKLRVQEKVLLGKLSKGKALSADPTPSPPTLDQQLTALSTDTTSLYFRSDQLNARLAAANKDAEEILLRAQLATEKIRQLQTSQRFLNSDTIAKSAQGLPVAYVISDRAQLVADPEQPELVLATILRGTPVFIEYLAQSQYRIVTSTGVRGWLSGKELVFRPDDFHPSSSVVRIKAVQPLSGLPPLEAVPNYPNTQKSYPN